MREGTEQLLSRDTVHTQSTLYTRASQYLPARSPPGLSDFQRLALILFFEGSIKLDRDRTELAREQARMAVPTTKGEVLPGERVIAAHEQIQERELERLEAYRHHLQQRGSLGDGTPRYPQEIGTFLLNLLILAVFGFLLLFYRPTVYENVRHVLLIAILIALLAGAAAIIDRSGAPPELVPIAFPALVVAVLWDGRMAMNLALVLAALL